MALAYRSHFIFINRPLINSKGLNTSAAYGFTSALLKLIEDHNIEHVAVVFDVMEEGGTFRDELYEDYKAHRDPPPDELIANIPIIKQVVEAFDIPVLEMGGVEADDVIGTLARKAEAEDQDVVIVSPDKDFQQLLSNNISQFRPAYRGESFDPVTVDSFREKYELEPSQFIDILALMGDAADNVPGVPGIGEKTALKLIHEYASVEALLENAENVKGKKAREGLLGHADAALLSKRLVTIETGLDVELNWKKLHRANPNAAVIRRVFKELEFSTLATRTERILGLGQSDGQPDLFAPVGSPNAAVGVTEDESDEDRVFSAYHADDVDYVTVRNMKQLRSLVDRVRDVATLSVDTETTSKDEMLASLVGVSLSWDSSVAAYVPTPLPDGTSTEEVLSELRPLLESDCLKVGQNIKYDLIVLSRHGVRLGGDLFDTMIAHYLIAPEKPHNLDALARAYLDYAPIPIENLIGSGRSQKSMRDVPVEDVGPYACEDADITLRLYGIFEPMLEEANAISIATDVEFPLVRALADMELAGIALDVDVLEAISKTTSDEIVELEKEIYEQAGESFNIGSPAQLGEILFDRLGLRVAAKTSTGKASTKESVLQELASEHELPALILDWRELSKLKSTYIDALPRLINSETGRIHTHYNQTVAATGRLSSQDPNLQNIPVRSERGRAIRKAFVAPDGRSLLAADYVQIELRILASMSGDEALTEAFRSGEDIHTATASRVFGVDPTEVTRTMRSKAKEVNYGIPYGMSAFGLAQRLRVSRTEAQELISSYQQSYPSVTRFLSELVERAREVGYAETLLGRRRYIPDLYVRNRVQRSAAERIAVNMPVQGTQADMIKIAMNKLRIAFADRQLKSRMLLQVHDELVFEVVKGEEKEVEQVVRELMISALPLNVPIAVDISVADNWLDAH